MNGTRGTVVVMQLASFLVFVIGRSPDNVQVSESNLWGWALLTIILAIGVDMGSVGEVSAALAVLIFVTVMLLYGVDVANWLMKKTGQSNVSGGAGSPRKA